jgi:hypothetical protein
LVSKIKATAKQLRASNFSFVEQATASVLGEAAQAVQSAFKGEPMTRTLKMLCVAVLTIVGLVGSSLMARADDRDDHERHERCERQIHQAEDRLRDAVQRHGEESRQAHKRREQLEDAKRRCGDHDRDHHDDDHDHH